MVLISFHHDSLATGMGAKEDMFTSFLDLRGLYPLMTLLTSTLMQMLTRLVTGEASVNIRDILILFLLLVVSN